MLCKTIEINSGLHSKSTILILFLSCLRLMQNDCNNVCPWVILGKTPQLYRHDLLALQSKQSHRFTMHMNRIPERLVPRKFALTTKVPDTKGCTKCCVGRNPYNGYKYLCGAMITGIFLMQWYDPLNKFMLLKVRTECFI